jgi:hypothetical protein
MRIIPVILSFAILPTVLAQHAFSAEERFADATETNEQLMKLFDQAGDTCLPQAKSRCSSNRYLSCDDHLRARAE